MAPPLAITERRVGSCCVLRVAGRLVAEDNSRLFRDTLDALMERGFQQFVLNMCDVRALDSGGVGSIVSKYLRAHRAGGDVKLACLSERAEHVLGIAGLLTVFQVFDNEDLAAASFSSSVTRA